MNTNIAKITILENYLLYIGNICDETPTLQIYWLCIVTIDKEIEQYFLRVLQQYWQSVNNQMLRQY